MPTSLGRCVSALLSLWVLLVCSRATADGGPGDRIVLVTADSAGALAASFSGELRAAGFDVVAVPLPPGDPGWEELLAIARARKAAAAVWFAPDGQGLTIWVADRVTGKIVARRIPGPAPTDRAEVKLAALRGVELLRASLRELEGPAAREFGSVAPTAAVKRLARPPPPTYFVELGGSVAGSAGGVPPTGQFWAGARFMFHPWVGLRFGAMIPVVGTPLRGDEGFARISIAQLMVGPHAALRRPGVIVRPDVGLLAGLSILHFDGVASPPLFGRTDRLLAFTTRLTAGLSLRMTRALRLRADAAVGVSLPEFAIEFAGRRAGTWGLPFGSGTLAIEIGLN